MLSFKAKRLSLLLCLCAAILCGCSASFERSEPEHALRCVSVAGTRYPIDTEFLDLSELSDADAFRSAGGLSRLPQLREVKLGERSFELYARLKAHAPQAAFQCSFRLFGQDLSADTVKAKFIREEIDYEYAKLILQSMDKLQSVYFEDCPMSNEELGLLREEFPGREIHWLLDLRWADVRTDAETVWLIGGYNDDRLCQLKYCTKVKYLDVGHNNFTDLSFVENMPDLEVLIAFSADITDISVLENCPKLEYLELCHSFVTDLSPLQNCHKLAHLNIGSMRFLKDITPLFGIPSLERLFAYNCYSIPEYQLDEFKKLYPQCELATGYMASPVRGRWRVVNGLYTERYALLREQIGYDG